MGLEAQAPAVGGNVGVAEQAEAVFAAYRTVGGTQGVEPLKNGFQELGGIAKMPGVTALQFFSGVLHGLISNKPGAGETGPWVAGVQARATQGDKSPWDARPFIF